ncbi:hypothetical protein [Nocardiopsis potens]|nr:hypothetical protein [Nocardiopsis potens]
MDVRTRREGQTRPRRGTVDLASLVFWTAVVAIALIAFLPT